jgi:hypothetical protein
MDEKKRTSLEHGGWSAGSAQDFLSLSDEEAAVVEVKLAPHTAVSSTRPPGCAGTMSTPSQPSTAS